MDFSGGALAQMTLTPSRQLGRRPLGKFCQGVTPWKEGVHDDKPTPQETVATLPDTRQAAKQQRNENG